ncbi:hypothetical protein FNU55_21095 [Salmonella enterica]|nr:hypothetical protein [Salmonella enterica]ECH7161949.1 hypothetical protein [Salmonella enterica]
MEFILFGFVFIVLLSNLGGVLALLESAILKATSKSLFIAAATFLSIYGITNALVEEKSAAEIGVLEGVGVGMQNLLRSIYLYSGIALLVWGGIRKIFEIKGLVKKD